MRGPSTSHCLFLVIRQCNVSNTTLVTAGLVLVLKHFDWNTSQGTKCTRGMRPQATKVTDRCPWWPDKQQHSFILSKFMGNYPLEPMNKYQVASAMLLLLSSKPFWSILVDQRHTCGRLHKSYYKSGRKFCLTSGVAKNLNKSGRNFVWPVAQQKSQHTKLVANKSTDKLGEFISSQSKLTV